MSALSDYLEDKLAKHMIGTPYTAPAALYLALFTDSPGEDASGTEVTEAAYARIDLTASGITDNADGTLQNTAQLVSAAAGATWGLITHMAIFDALTTGNMLWHGAVGVPKTVDTGDRFVQDAGNLVFGFI